MANRVPRDRLEPVSVLELRARDGDQASITETIKAARLDALHNRPDIRQQHPVSTRAKVGKLALREASI
jgi:hypothetical protein